MFVMASLAARDGSGPVKVRNLSSSGALVEGGVLPSPGEAVSLLRGALRIDGNVVWCRGGKAGLRFDAAVNVSDWLPKGIVQNRNQQSEALINHFKADTVTRLAAFKYHDVAPSGITAAEVKTLAVDLQVLADRLADDDVVIIRHGDKLQILDAVVQALDKLAIMTARDALKTA